MHPTGAEAGLSIRRGGSRRTSRTSGGSKNKDLTKTSGMLFPKPLASGKCNGGLNDTFRYRGRAKWTLGPPLVTLENPSLVNFLDKVPLVNSCNKS